MLFSDGWCGSHDATVLYSPDDWLSRHSHNTAARAFRWSLYSFYRKKKGPMTKWVHHDMQASAINDLRCYITMEIFIYGTWGKSKRSWGKRTWLLPSWPIALPYKSSLTKNFKSLIGEFEAGINVEVELFNQSKGSKVNPSFLFEICVGIGVWKKRKYPCITTLALLIVECHGWQWYLMTHYTVPGDIIITHYTVPEDTEVFNSM